jgi:hypothetical protein
MALSAGRVRRPLPLGLRGMAIGQDQMLDSPGNWIRNLPLVYNRSRLGGGMAGPQGLVPGVRVPPVGHSIAVDFWV